jgi:flagellar hook protein FlgE
LLSHKELVDLIVAQRNFQANAQVVQAEDAITQTIINMR